MKMKKIGMALIVTLLSAFLLCGNSIAFASEKDDLYQMLEAKRQEVTQMEQERAEWKEKIDELKALAETAENTMNDAENVLLAQEENAKQAFEGTGYDYDMVYNEPVIEEDFLYLNDVIASVKEAQQKYDAAKSAYDEAYTNAYNEEISYMLTEKGLSYAKGSLFMMEEEYNNYLEQDTSSEQTEYSPASTEKSISNPNLEKSTVSPKTGDRTGVVCGVILLIGVFPMMIYIKIKMNI